MSKTTKAILNVENRLVSVAPQTPANGDTRVEFLYDYMGRRVSKILSEFNGTDWTQTSTTLYVYDGWNLIQELDGTQSTPTVQKSYAWGLDLSQSLQGAGGVGGLLASVEGSNTYLYCYDANGNVGQMVNASDGSLVANYQYDPFGKTISADGLLKDSNPFRFSTKYADAETGLYYYGYRYYSAEMGRWLNRDPLGEEGGINVYKFVRNNSIVLYDPYGLSSPKGHHKIPVSVFNNIVADEIAEFWDSDAARIFNKHYKEHNFKALRGVSHAKYNKMVKEELEKFLGSPKIKEITMEQAVKFLTHIENMPNSSIGMFNAAVRAEMRKSIRNKLRKNAQDFAESTLRKGIQKGAKGAKKSIRELPVIGFFVTLTYYVLGSDDKSFADAAGDAIRDQVTPLSVDLTIEATEYAADKIGESISTSPIAVKLYERRLQLEDAYKATDIETCE